jgi:hypothetical protein
MTWGAWYDVTVDKMRTLRGVGAAKDPRGQPLPLLQAQDMVALLGLVSPQIVATVKDQNEHGDRVPAAEYVDTDGELAGGIGAIATEGTNASFSCSAAQYVAGIGQTAAPWVRSVAIWSEDKLDADNLFASIVNPYLDTSKPDAPRLYTPSQAAHNRDNLNFLRQAMADWQRAIDVSVRSLQNNALGNPSSDDTTAFFAALAALCSDLDVLAENPPAELDIAGALSAALSASSKAAGQISGAVANAAGEAAGAFGEGFLSKASIVTLIVTGAVVYLYVFK